MRRFISSLKYPFAVLFWLAVWHVASEIIANSIIIVSPIAAFARLLELAAQGHFWQSVGASLFRIVLGFVLALVLGVAAAATSASKFLYTLTLPMFNILKSIPVASFIILAWMWMSSQNLSTFIAFVTVLPIVYFNTYEGIKTTDAKLLEMARVFRVGSYKIARDIYFPAVLPHVVSAASSGLGFAFKSGIAAEIIGLARGTIGFNLHTARIFLQTADVFAWTIAIVLLSYAMEKIFKLLMKKVKHDAKS
ncbi:MAG: ABC transporter permease subunit [Clostridiales bacterium]|jgi:NitT/TauT family transport system permease protein|nr:ABC transporter permease subunit [Clostridiales bacterium]